MKRWFASDKRIIDSLQAIRAMASSKISSQMLSAQTLEWMLFGEGRLSKLQKAIRQMIARWDSDASLSSITLDVDEATGNIRIAPIFRCGFDNARNFSAAMEDVSARVVNLCSPLVDMIDNDLFDGEEQIVWEPAEEISSGTYGDFAIEFRIPITSADNGNIQVEVSFIITYVMEGIRPPGWSEDSSDSVPIPVNIFNARIGKHVLSREEEEEEEED